MAELTIIGLVPFGIAGSICQKSPPKTTTFPPNGLSLFPSFWNLRISRIVLSSASKQCLCVIGASSHIISLDLIISSDSGLSCVTLQVESSLTFTGIENLEWAVLPPGISKEAMPLEATVRTIHLWISEKLQGLARYKSFLHHQTH